MRRRTTRSTSAISGGDDDAATAENRRRLLADFAPDDVLCDLDQVHGADVDVVDGPWAGRGPRRRRAGHHPPGVGLMVRAADCVPVLLAAPDDGRGRRRPLRPARHGRRRRRRRRSPAMRELGAGRIAAWVGPHVCGRCYEVPEQLRAEVAAVVPDSCAETSWGTPSLDLGAGVARPARRRRRRRPRRRPLHPRVRATSTPTAATAPARAGSPAWSGSGADGMSRRDEIEAGLAPVRGRIAAACADAGRDARTRSGWSWSPSSSRPATSGSSPSSASPTSARTATRRPRPRPPSAPTSTCAWHFIGGLQSNKAAAVASYAAVVESVDRRKLVGPLARGAHAAVPRRSTCCSRSRSTRPGATGRAGADPGELAELAAAVDERRACSSCAA